MFNDLYYAHIECFTMLYNLNRMVFHPSAGLVNTFAYTHLMPCFLFTLQDKVFGCFSYTCKHMMPMIIFLMCRQVTRNE